MGGVRDDWNGRPRVGTVGERSQAGVSALVTRRSTAELFPLISISGPVEAGLDGVRFDPDDDFPLISISGPVEAHTART